MRAYDTSVFEEVFSSHKSHYLFSEREVRAIRPETEVNDARRPLEPHERYFLRNPEFQLVEKYQGGLTGNYLAALMLFGRGALVADMFGDWSDGPDKSMLRELSEEAERALCEAYAAYGEAEAIVGKYPLEKWNEASRLCREYREANHAANEREGVGKVPFLYDDKPESLAHIERERKKRKRAVESTADISTLLDDATKEAEVAHEAWLKAMVRQLLPPAPVVVALKFNVVKRTKRVSWQDVALPYLFDTFQSGQYATAKDFYQALKNKVGTGSPFDLGTGANRGSLFVREIGKPLHLKTLENYMPKIRSAKKIS